MWLVRRDIQGVGKDFFVKENFASVVGGWWERWRWARSGALPECGRGG